MKRLVIYHDDADGIGSAYCAWTRYGNKDTDYVSTNYGEAVVDMENYDELFILDFSYKRDVLLAIADLFDGRVTVLDHHKTAAEDLEGLAFCRYEPEESGAMMSWKYFNNYNPHLPPPRLIELIQDHDLWQFKYGDETRRFSAAFQSYGKPGFGEIRKWIRKWNEFGPRLQDEGEAIMRYQRQIINRNKATAHRATWIIKGEIVEIPVVNTRECISQTGNELAKGEKFAVMYFDVNGQRTWSMRSVEGGMDVSEIAKMKGGGGHKHAAGFHTFDDEGPILTFEDEE